MVLERKEQRCGYVIGKKRCDVGEISENREGSVKRPGIETQMEL